MAQRIAEVVKRVSRNCSDGVQEAAVRAADAKTAGGGCFTGCPQPANTSSACWIKCYFDTLLGDGAGSRVVGSAGGMSLESVRAAWEAPFETEDMAKGGCPSI